MGKQIESEYEIEFDHVRKQYGDFTAVEDSTFGIRHGEFFSLLGPSGCGKTTTLRMVSGLEAPTRGKIFLAGADVTNVPPYKRDVNTVFQDYALFPHMNIYKNVYFPLKMKGVGIKEADPQIRDILKLVEMEDFADRLPQQLSGGQRQRIALARSLVNRPRALLLDEPLGALDYKLRLSMQTVLKDIQKNVDITFIYVTHDQTEAITMSDRICVMKQGVIHQIGTPEEIYNKPKTKFVANFIGEMNFLSGTVTEARDDHTKVEVGGALICVKNSSVSVKAGDRVSVGIRPERITTVRPEGDAFNTLSGVISRIVFRGNDYDLRAAVGDNEVRIAESAIGYRHRELGAPITLYFEQDAAIVFADEEL